MSEGADGAVTPDRDEVTHRRIVRDRYARIATESSTCCGENACSGADADTASQLGYTDEDLAAVAEGANLGLGCGNPNAIAALRPGETVLDLGSGAGFDCFLAANAVGEGGRIIGVDMTPEMVEKARENARINGVGNVEFRLGEIEHLPVEDASVDVIISNCVINLSPDKPQVFREAYRVLAPGGRVAVSDVVQTVTLPDGVVRDPTALAACVAGASPIDSIESMLDSAGFDRIQVEAMDDSDTVIREWDDRHDLSDYLVSASITAEKPETDRDGPRD